MKRLISLLLIITLLLSACTSPEEPESGEVQEPVESVESSDLPEDVGEEESVEEIQEESKPEEMPENVEPEEEKENIYNYKGIDIPGRHDEDSYFYVNTNLLNETESGQQLLKVSYDATMAFIANDTDELLKYFGEEHKQNQIKYMNWIADNLKESKKEKTDRINRLNYLDIRNSVINKNNNYINVYYYAIFTPLEPAHSIDIEMRIYLNENNEWKFMDIGYTDLAC